jgi:hypothetical protein
LCTALTIIPLILLWNLPLSFWNIRHHTLPLRPLITREISFICLLLLVSLGFVLQSHVNRQKSQSSLHCTHNVPSTSFLQSPVFSNTAQQRYTYHYALINTVYFLRCPYFMQTDTCFFIQRVFSIILLHSMNKKVYLIRILELRSRALV